MRAALIDGMKLLGEQKAYSYNWDSEELKLRLRGNR